MLFQHAGDGIGAGEYGFTLLPGNRRAAYTAHLPDNRGDVHPGPQRQRYEAAGRFQLRRGTAARFPEVGEDFADAVLVRINRNVDIAAAGGNPFRKAAVYLGPLARR